MTSNIAYFPGEQTASARAQPSQQRSAERLNDLLDAAAEIVDEVGYARLTTALVAERAESAIGTLYRYFPDRNSLLRALRDRELQRFRSLVIEKLKSAPLDRISDGADRVVDAFAEMYRTEPGFRIIRFEGSESDPAMDDDYARPGFFARQYINMLSHEFGFDVEDDEAMFRMEIVVETANAIVNRAFKTNPDGDPVFIEEARAMARDYIHRYFDDRGTSAV